MVEVQVAPPGTAERNLRFLEEVSGRTAGVSRLEMCIQCGTCGGSCPSADDMDHTPRQLFAMIRAGMRRQALASNTPWMCVSCYHCVTRCPQGVHVTDVMYALKCLALEEHGYRSSVAPGFSKTFVGNVERFGRSYEIGLTALHYLHYYPTRLPGIAPMGIGMVTKGRISFRPKRIRQVRQLRAILAKAREMEARA